MRTSEARELPFSRFAGRHPAWTVVIALGLLFLAMAGWALVPDTISDADAGRMAARGAFIATAVAFFLAEMGDKTQIATVMLAARYDAIVAVVAGTTLGMMLANAPVVWLGERMTRVVPIRTVHVVSAAIFVVLGVVALVGWD